MGIGHIGRAGLAGLMFVAAAAAHAAPEAVSEADLAKIEAAAPATAPTKPGAPRSVLVFGKCEGATHQSIRYCAAAFGILGKKTGAFSTDYSDDMAAFSSTNLARFDAVVLDNTTCLKFEDAAQRSALLGFVKGGKGLVGIHAATDNFYSWAEGAAMIGGMFDGHPWTADGTWVVKNDAPGNPINASFEGKGFSIQEELYQIKGPYSRQTHRVLLSLDMTAEANKAPGGQNRADKDNAIAWIKRYGNGRVFYCSLGHNNEVYWNPAVLRHYLAGIQYALGDLAADDSPSTPPTIVVPPEALSFAYASNRTWCAQLEQSVQRGGYEADAAIATLCAVLDSAGATRDAKAAACRVLRIGAATNAVPSLVRLLNDKELADMARFALEGIADPAVDTALIGALRVAGNEAKPGLVASLGARRSIRALDVIAPLASGTDTTAAIALDALGHLGTRAAADALGAATVGPALAERRDQALLECAGRMRDSGVTQSSLGICSRLVREGATAPIRSLALRITLQATGPAAAIDAVLSTNQILQDAGRAVVLGTKGSPMAAALIARLASASAQHQMLLLELIGLRRDMAAQEAVGMLASSTNKAVALVALHTLGFVGDAAAVPFLLDAVVAGGDTGAAAAEALRTMTPPNVNRRLCKLFGSPNAAWREAIVEALAARNDQRATPVFIRAAVEATNSEQRVAMLTMLRPLAREYDLYAVLRLLDLAQSPGERTALARIIASIASRADDKASAATNVICRMATADALTLETLLETCPAFGTTNICAVACAAMTNPIVPVCKAALRALAAWPDDTPLDALVAFAESGPERDDACGILALRAVAAVAAKPASRSNAVIAGLVGRALARAQRADEKRLLVPVLAKCPSPEALALLDACKTDADVSELVKDSRATVAAELLRRTLGAHASVNDDSARSAIDGDPETSWDTGREMQPGDWFSVDLGRVAVLHSLTLNCEGSPDDYPRKFDVFLSADGTTWESSPVLSGEGTKPVVEILFPQEPKARAVKIVQQGKAPDVFWSINELTVKAE